MAQDIADHTVVVAHTEDTADTVEDIVVVAGIAAVEDMVPIAHSLFVVSHRLPKLGGHIRHKN